MEPTNAPGAPKTTPSAMDVTLPTKPVAPAPVAVDEVHAAPPEVQPAPPQLDEPNKPPVEAKKPVPVPKAKSTAPVAAILVAVILFVVLSGLAYYAYTQNN